MRQENSTKNKTMQNEFETRAPIGWVISVHTHSIEIQN